MLKTWNWSLLHLFSSFQHFGYLLDFENLMLKPAQMVFKFSKKKVNFKFWKPDIKACSIGFQVFNICLL